MRKREYVPVTRNEEVLHSVVCNKCGEEHFPDDDNGELLHIHKTSVDFDGERNYYRSKCWWFDLCDKCLIDLVKTFKYAPDWFMGSMGDCSQKEFDEWVKDECKPMSRF